jgi:hypothetical protein
MRDGCLGNEHITFYAKRKSHVVERRFLGDSVEVGNVNASHLRLKNRAFGMPLVS